jgi:hypothetical protein
MSIDGKLEPSTVDTNSDNTQYNALFFIAGRTAAQTVITQ